MDLTIKVTDVVGVPISGADILVLLSLSGLPITGKSDQNGAFSVSQPPSVLSQVKVSHPAYFSEEVKVIQSAGNFLWDNPVCHVAQTGNVTIRLSRLCIAPTFTMSDADLDGYPPFNPKGVFTWRDSEGNLTGRYLASY